MKSNLLVKRIISGGQTGADRGGLDAAEVLRMPKVGGWGWCPKGRRAEDGQISSHYPLRETPSSGYMQRTEWNVRDSSATWIFLGPLGMTPGSYQTVEFCLALDKPHLTLFPLAPFPGHTFEYLRGWLKSHKVYCLNVAGTRESKARGIQEATTRLLLNILR